MKTAAQAVAFLFLFLSSFLTSAQNPVLSLSYQSPDSLFVCGTDEFTIAVQNSGGQLTAGANFNVALPNGLQYVAGSVTGASQLNISDLKNPVFSLPAIASGTSAIVKISLRADCSAADILDAGGLFPAQLSVAAPNANASLTTTSIPVETGLILIESVDHTLLEGERFDTLYRTICIRNTRLGKIGLLRFEDLHQPGFDVSVINAQTQNNATGLFTATFGTALFQTTGNGDAWLDMDETVCITEKIVITDCGIPEFLNLSLLKVGWGCGGNICRFDQTSANVQIRRSTKVPDLVVTPVWNEPTDNCANTGATIGLKIKNQGLGKAENTSVKFTMADFPDKVAISPGSFRLVGSNNIVTPLALNLSTPVTLSGCSSVAASDASLTVPLVAPGDSLQLLFEVLNCVESCRQELPTVYVEYFYKKPCPINGFVSDTIIITPDGAYNITSSLSMNIGACLETGHSYPAFLKVDSKRLSGTEGFLNIEFELPHGITIDSSCGTMLNGVAPQSVTVSPASENGTVTHLSYALPLPAESVGMNFCLHYECDSNLVCKSPPPGPNGTEVIYAADCRPCFGLFKERAYWTPELTTPSKCGIGDCHDIFLALDASICDGQPGEGGGNGDTSGMAPSYPIDYHWKMDVARINFGLRDAQNDRVADGGPALASEVRLDRYLPGDTSRVTYCGYMGPNVLDTSITVFPRVIWHEVVRSDVGAPWDNDDFVLEPTRVNFTNTQHIRFIHDSIRVRYADGSEFAFAIFDSTGSSDKSSFVIYSVNAFPPVALDLVVSKRFQFNVSLPALHSAGLLPKPTLNAGDSIFFYTDFKMDMNFNTPLQGKKDPPLIGFRTALALAGGKYAWNFYPFKRMQYSGYLPSISRNTFNIRPCENSVEVKKFRYAVRLARENLFPFEVRPLARIVNFGQTVPDGLNVTSVKLQYLALQDSLNILANLNLPFSQSPGRMDVDFSGIFNQPFDEGFQLATNITFGPDCRFNVPDTSDQWIGVQYNTCIGGEFPLIQDTLHNSIGFFTSHPQLTMLSPDSILYSPSRTFDIDFTLKNPLSVGAQHPWVTVQSASGLVTDYELIALPQNQVLSAQNGIFNLAALPGFNQASFRLNARNGACETDTLRLIYGWDCNVTTDLDQATCYRDTYLILLNLEKPELELNILSEPLSIELCDTSGYAEFEIYNANIGYAYDLIASLKLPDGLQIVPGTSQLFYYTPGVWANIADPLANGGNIFNWSINENQDSIKTNGLPGFNLNPKNIIRIRFKVIASCGFVSNTQIIYGAYGKESCNKSTNILNKPGGYINLQGLTPTYEAQPQLMVIGNQPAVCGGEGSFEVQINLLGIVSPGDSAVVTFPQGVSLLSGSYQPLDNAPAGPPTLIPGGFRIALPVLSGNGVVKFTFKVNYGQGSGCSDQIISIQTRAHSQAFCQSEGQSCEVYVSTGSHHLNIQVQHPELTLGAVQNSSNGGQTSVSIPVNNIGNYAASGATVQLWQDNDGNEQLSAGDVLIQTFQNGQTINPGGSVLLSGTLNITAAQWCNMLIVLPALENCTCSDLILPAGNLEIEHETLALCEIQPVQLGVDPIPGYQYQWQNIPGIACATCATTLFTPDANTQPGESVTLELEESSGDCKVVHRFEVIFGAQASITQSNSIICAGNSLTLTAFPPDATYFWQGEGIQSPGQQVQTLQPATSGSYQLTVTLASGCTLSATANVIVNPVDTLRLPAIYACKDSVIQVFGQNVAASTTEYNMHALNIHSCDSVIYQPVVALSNVLTADSVFFCAGDTVLVFGQPVSTSMQLCRHYEAANNCDSTHCTSTFLLETPTLAQQDTVFAEYGVPLEIGGLGGYSSYTWNPAPDTGIVNGPSIFVPTDSTGYFEYELTVENEEGCSGSVVWRVVVPPPAPPCGQEIDIPNAFTPNGDGYNDFFRPLEREGSEVYRRLTIFDRWGEKVFDSYTVFSWDGTIRGKPASSDVYIYILEYDCGGLRQKPKHSEVTLIR